LAAPDLDLIKQAEQGCGTDAGGSPGAQCQAFTSLHPGFERKSRLYLTRRYSCLRLTIYGQSIKSVLEDVLGTTVSVAQAKSQFAALVARAEAGETIVVTRSGRAVACLGPLPRRQPIKYGELSGVFLSEDLTLPEEVIRDFEQSK
jgi:prevent-host-death family protein